MRSSRRELLANHLIDATARRPRGAVAARPYLGHNGAPRRHEPGFDLIVGRVGPLHGQHVLDVGCGGGRLLARLLAAGAFRATGLDHSPAMIRAARRHNTIADETRRLEVREGDAHELPFPDAAFNVVVAANLLCFLERPEAALAEWFRVLRPGGRLALATRPGPLPRASLRHPWVGVWGPKLRVYDDPELRALLEVAGFTGVAVDQVAGVQVALAARLGLRERPA